MIPSVLARQMQEGVEYFDCTPKNVDGTGIAVWLCMAFFRPPFCPNPDCDFHTNPDPSRFPWNLA